MDFEQWLQRAQSLNLAVIGGRRAPYKPAMLLAAILLVRKGQFADNLLLFPELCSAFDQVLQLVAPQNDGPTERVLPFHHLANDGIWVLVARVGEDEALAQRMALGARAREVLQHVAGACLPDPVFQALRNSAAHALRAVEVVFRHHEAVFRSWGLTDPGAALQVLQSWLAGADQLLAEVRTAEPSRTMREREVEEAIQQRWATTPFGQRGLKLVERQYVTPVNTIDLLAHEPNSGTWWVVELKRRNHSDAVVGQLSRYRGWIARDRGVPVEQACGIILTDSVSEQLRYAVDVQRGVELWQYDDALAITQVGA